MKPYEINSPCSPGDQVYLVCNDGIRLLFVREIQIYKDYERDEVVTAICFADYPYIVLTDETRGRIFNNLDEAKKALKEFDNG